MQEPLTPNLLRHLYITILLGITLSVNAQNLIPNPSFETYTTCPYSGGAICNGFGPPWTCGSTGTVDLFNACAGPGSLVYVPDNVMGSQAAITGNGYAGLLARWPLANYREYLMVQLPTPLTADTWYYLSFYVSLAETACGIEPIGVYFGVTNPYINNWFVMPVTPQIENNSGFISDKVNWVLIAGCFQAEGDEQYMVIGNFRDDSETPFDSNCGSGYAYYYLEDVVLMEGAPPEENELDLGGPESACLSYTIVPDNPGPLYYWSDGSQQPTLTVTESGTYALTVSDGCSVGVDSIEITINGNNPPVEIVPTNVVICNGDTYTVSLDPELSEYTWNDGSNDAEYSITTSGTYSVTLDDGCVSTTDAITVEVLDAPAPFDLGDDDFLCYGDESIITLDPALGDFLWQDGNTTSTYTISGGGQYAVTISNMCGQESDEILVIDLEVPEVEIGPVELLLCDGDLLEIDIDPALGYILWQDGSNESNYEINTAGIYTVSVTNQCGTSSDQINISTLNSPDAFLGNDTILCEGDLLLLSVNSPEGSYLWQDNSTDAQFEVTSPGIYAVTISNLCGFVSTDVSIEYTSLVVSPDFGPDVTLCPGEQIILDADNPGATYLWQDMSVGNSFTVTTPGTYFVQVSNTCSLADDTIVVNYTDNQPQVDLPSLLTLCQGENLMLDAVISGVNYLWNDNSQGQQLLVNAPGTYSVTVYNACGTDTDTTIILSGGPAPAVTLGNDIAICAGDTVILSPVFSNVDAWLWQDGSTLPLYTALAPGVITVAVSNACSTSYDTLVVNTLPLTLPLSLGADTVLCSGQSFVLSINTPGVNILWPDGSTDPDYNVISAGPVIASISNSCGQSFDTLQVVALTDIPALNLGPDQSLCPGENITLTPGIPNVTYTWQDGSNGFYFQSVQQETIILTIMNECGMATDTVEITETTQGPQLDLGNDIQACEGEIVTIPSGISGVEYLWQDGSMDPQYVTPQSGVFILQVSNNCGVDTDTIVVDIAGTPPTPALGGDTILCIGVSLQLQSNADSETNIQWQDGSSTPSFTVTTAGTYTLSESNRCGDAADTIVVSYLDAPDPFSLGSDTTLCPGESITLNAPLTPYTIQWNDGGAQPSLVTDQAGTYFLQVINDCGVNADSIVVAISEAPPTPTLGADTTLCVGVSLQLQSNAGSETSIEWQDGSATPSFIVNTSGTFTLSESNRCGDAADTIVVSYIDAPTPFTLGPDTTLCPGESITLIAPLSPYFLEWQDGSSQQSLLADQAGTYSLRVSNGCGVVTDAIVLDVDTRQPILDFDTTIPWCAGDIITLDATQSFQASYTWSTGSSSPSVQITSPGVYSVEVTTPCRSVSQTIDVFTAFDCEGIEVRNEIYIPNVFSPNGDGINDLFAVSFGPDLEVISITGSIFDRWGNLVFSSDALTFTWNGEFVGEAVQPGVYVYLINITHMFDKKEVARVFSGDVTLIR